MKFLGWLSIFIFIFSLLNYSLSTYLHFDIFNGFYSTFIMGVLPLFGLIFGVWSFGWRRGIGLLGNTVIFCVAVLLPLFQFFF